MQWQEHQYTPSVLSAVEGFVSKDNLTSPQWQAAVRAITRHKQSADQTGSSTRVPGGLHPMYVGLQETTPDAQDRKGLLENTMADVVDAACIHFLSVTELLTFEKLTVLDRIDGGISLLLHCPGHLVTADTNVEDIPIEMYATGRETKTLGMQERLVHLIQAFGDQIALPHLHRFTGRYETEQSPGITPPGKFISL
jgi:hypothetical protein